MCRQSDSQFQRSSVSVEEGQLHYDRLNICNEESNQAQTQGDTKPAMQPGTVLYYTVLHYTALYITALTMLPPPSPRDLDSPIMGRPNPRWGSSAWRGRDVRG